ncbi:hypothetical protein D3C78_1461510 [compost metagenome]
MFGLNRLSLLGIPEKGDGETTVGLEVIFPGGTGICRFLPVGLSMNPALAVRRGSTHLWNEMTHERQVFNGVHIPRESRISIVERLCRFLCALKTVPHG